MTLLPLSRLLIANLFILVYLAWEWWGVSYAQDSLRSIKIGMAIGLQGVGWMCLARNSNTSNPGWPGQVEAAMPLLVLLVASDWLCGLWAIWQTLWPNEALARFRASWPYICLVGAALGMWLQPLRFLGLLSYSSRILKPRTIEFLVGTFFFGSVIFLAAYTCNELFPQAEYHQRAFIDSVQPSGFHRLSWGGKRLRLALVEPWVPGSFEENVQIWKDGKPRRVWEIPMLREWSETISRESMVTLHFRRGLLGWEQVTAVEFR